MNSNAVNALLEEGSLEKFRPIGVFGKPAWQSHLQLRTIVRQRLGELHSNYFAIPSVDSKTGLIRWVSPAAGSPKPWSELSAEERLKHEPTRIRVQEEIRWLAESLRAQEAAGTSSSAVASLLESALRTPQASHHLFLVGEQPVLAFWGHEDQTGASSVTGWEQGPKRLPDLPAPDPRVDAVDAVDAVDIGRQAPGSSPAPTELPNSNASFISTPEHRTVATGLTAQSDRRRFLWWYWPETWPAWLARALLGLLGLLLLLALLSWLLPRSCSTGTAVPRAAPRGGLEFGSQTAPVREPGAALPGATPSTQPPSAQTTQSEDPVARDAEPGPKSSDVPAFSKPQTSPPAEELSLGNRRPDDRDLSFLKGKWKAGEGLFDRRSGQALEVSLEFDDKGKGEMLVRKPDGTQCRAPIAADMTDGRLGIGGPSRMACPDGSFFPAPKVECRLARNDQTECFGLNPDGSRYFMEVRRR